MRAAPAFTWHHGGVVSLPSSLRPAYDWVDEQITPLVVATKLRSLATIMRLPGIAQHLVAADDGAFTAVIQFETADGVAICANLRDGKMQVTHGLAASPDVVLRFRQRRALRDFFSGGDLFNMLLANEVEFSGNLSCLARFGHLAITARQRGKKSCAVVMPATNWPEMAVASPGQPCLARPPGEVVLLTDPYLAEYDLDDFPRVKRLLWVHRNRQPEICTERPRLLTEFARRHPLDEAASPGLNQGRALRYILTRKRPIIHDDDLLAGTTTSKRIGVVIYPELGGTAIWPELLTVEGRELNPYRISHADVRVLEREVFPHWTRDNIREWTRRHFDDPESLELDGRFALYFMWKNYAVSHTVADFANVVGRGTDAIVAEAEQRAASADASRRPFYRSLVEALAGVASYATHLAEQAARLARTLPGNDAAARARRLELEEMARVCRRVPARPAETLAEALQSLWILFLALHQENMNAGLSLGRLDVWLDPYLQRDLGATAGAARRSAIERAIELTCAFMLKLTDHLPLAPDIANRLFGGSSSDQAITLGGVDEHGESAVCDMTWIFLKATEMLRLRDPNMNARFAPGINSSAYLRRLCEVNLLTRATPAIHNDAAMVDVLLGEGFTRVEARDWAATGCVEPTVSGRHFGHTGSIMLSLVAALEMALNDGVHPLLARQVGPATGDPRAMSSYAEFFAAYQTQLGALIDRVVDVNEMLGAAHRHLHPTPLLSALFQGPMESGRDLIDGGAPHNSTGVANVGLADVVDSLCAIRTLVFERERVDFAALLAAIADNFVGHEHLHSEIVARAAKFGDGSALPEEIAGELLSFIYERFHARAHYRGGRYQPGYWSMSNHVAFGILAGALPSGRRRGKAFAPGLTPTPLCAGSLTDQMHAVAGLDHSKMPNSLAFNVKVVPGREDSHAAVVDRMAAYVGAYFDLGGMQLQFNVVSSEVLRDAMLRPKDYGDLLVRISGYNAYFVELNRDMQIELIERMEHELG